MAYCMGGIAFYKDRMLLFDDKYYRKTTTYIDRFTGQDRNAPFGFMEYA